ncbi:hypothetical protein GOV04_03940 [Candidatus Woesearchaeota archaeon]|nr:hypothetical protein [Candidatus Woesearchaeota archaeon]
MTNIIMGILLTVFSSVFNAVGPFLIKQGVKKDQKIVELFFDKLVIGGLIVTFVGASIFVFALRFAQLSILYPFVAMTYAWVALLSKKYLDESITNKMWFGIILILLGVSIIGITS